MSFFENTRKPAGFGGRVMVSMMNPCHSPMDCGCGCGANLARLLKKCPGGIVKGVEQLKNSGTRKRPHPPAVGAAFSYVTGVSSATVTTGVSPSSPFGPCTLCSLRCSNSWIAPPCRSIPRKPLLHCMHQAVCLCGDWRKIRFLSFTSRWEMVYNISY